ncbi:MAG: right-handed parallel beta-helix repeat-containing protein, partial [Ktedonobacteraceae bacterium]|nr:right-handed parallel beta-helix repeat-containing protein [Ktedonobacteraceae bacterium]
LTNSEAERRQFVDLLVNACTQQEGPLIAILTLRTDFAPRLAEHPHLAALVQEHQATPPAPTPDELRAMIIQPANQPDVSIDFEKGLVDTLLSDAQGLSEVLPHLQITLSELFQQRTGNQLTLQTYHRLGGIKGAQARAAGHTPSSARGAALSQPRATRRTLLNLAVIALLLIALLGAAGEYYVSRQPSPLLVTNIHNSGTGSLRWCIDNAPTGGTITFDSGLQGTLTLTGNSLTVQMGKELTINGPGADRLTLHNGDAKPVLVVPEKSRLTISGLSFQGGKQAKQSILLNHGQLTINNSAISRNSSSGDGGGITSTNGTLALNYSTISGNSAENNGGGIYSYNSKITLNTSAVMKNVSSNGNGGGIYFFNGTLTMRNSTIASNSSSAGGGIYSYNNTLSLLNDTIADNSATINGGGILSYNSKLTLDKSTVFDNASKISGGGISTNVPDSPAAIRNRPVIVERSIIAGNRGAEGVDVSGTITTEGYNLFGQFAGANFTDSQSQHSTDKEVNRISDLRIDNMLNENGGSMMTHALLVGSPAIDAIPTSACDLKTADTDQRGVKRPQGGACDIGAYEYQARS